MGYSEAQHPRKEAVFYNDDFAQHRVVGVVQVIVLGVDLFRPALHRLRLRRTQRPLGLRLRAVSRVAPPAPTYFAPLSRQLSHSHFFGHLAETRFPYFGEGFHTLSAAAVLFVELLLV